MRSKEISRQNGKWVLCRCQVDDIGRWDGDKQILKLVLEGGEDITCTLWERDEIGIIDIDKEIPEFFSIRQQEGYFQCKVMPAPKDEVVQENGGYPDWDAIALGKCRHKHIDKLLERMLPTELLAKPEELEAISKLVEFEAKGTLT